MDLCRGRIPLDREPVSHSVHTWHAFNLSLSLSLCKERQKQVGQPWVSGPTLTSHFLLHVRLLALQKIPHTKHNMSTAVEITQYLCNCMSANNQTKKIIIKKINLTLLFQNIFFFPPFCICISAKTNACSPVFRLVFRSSLFMF